MKISIITINYNGSESTIKLLNSLNSQTDRDFSTIVTDNASEEVDFNNLEQEINRGILLDRMPLLIRNKENLGFSGGNNVGIKKALEMGTEWVVLLNNDTWAETGFAVSIKAIFGQKQGIWGLPMDEGGKIAFAGKIEWLKPTLRHIYAEGNPKSEILNPKQSSKIQNSKFKILDSRAYVIGGAMAIHRDVFEKIGFLDENYFLYFEDVDYSVRARKNNISIEILDKPLIHHTPSSTTKKLGKPMLLRYHYRNALYFNLKNGSWYIKLLVWPWSWWIILKQILKIMMHHNREESVAILKGVFDFYFNKLGKIKL